MARRSPIKGSGGVDQTSGTRLRRQTQREGSTDTRVGSGLRLGRDRKLELRPSEGVQEAPEGATLAEVTETLNRLLRSLKNGGMME